MEKNLYAECERCMQDEPAACGARCPMHVDVPSLCRELENGNFQKAYKVLEKRLPFAAMIGMICDHPCESRCVRQGLDAPISISELERAVVKYGHSPFKPSAIVQKSKSKVAVIGGGISGLVAAFDLNKKGFQVTIYEQTDRLGGSVWSYEGKRIDRARIEDELRIIDRLGITVKYNVRVRKRDIETLTAQYSALLLSTGSWEEIIPLDTNTLQAFNQAIFVCGYLANKDDSVILAANTGRTAATSIERYVKKISMTASRDREGAFETPMQYNLEDVASGERLEPSAEIFTEEEAKTEAARCLKCHCSQCTNACTHMKSFKVTPKKYGKQIEVNENIILGTHYANTMINSCALCGLCEEECPLNIGMKELVRITRESMVAKKKMPPSAHEFALRDMEFSNSDTFFMVKPPPLAKTEKMDYLFYPGCQLSASYPDYVEKTYDYLLSRIEEGVGIMLGCCGAPAEWAGRPELMQENISRFKTVWEKAGKPTFILACSSCMSIFEKYLPEISCLSLWDVFERRGLPEGIAVSEKRRLNVHDACATRNNEKLQKSVRSIAERLGYEIDELKYSGKRTKCCGYGGLVFYANQKQCEEFAEDRVKESAEDLLVYCAMCKDLFVRESKRTFHILDLLFAEDLEAAALRRMPNLSQRHANREDLKNNLLQRLWGEERGARATAENRLNLVISPEIWGKMEKMHILFVEIEKVVEFSKETGRRFYNETESCYLADLRMGNVTYWVRYAEAEDSILILDAYCHRMEIVNE